MKILILHNYYQQPGGEDEVVATESKLLIEKGHRVILFSEHNDQVDGLDRLTLARSTIWNTDVRRRLSRLVRDERPDVAHFHNTFPLISPAAYSAARAEGVPVVQTLHNYRLLCSNAQFFREGRPCEDCLGKIVPWPGIVHSCYRESRATTTVVVAMLTAHRALGTWSDHVDRYIVLTEFARRKFIEGGLPAEKLVVKPNSLHPDPGVGDGGGGFALFVGRLSAEKGIPTLLNAWIDHPPSLSLRIIGDGPLAPLVKEAVQNPRIEWLGRRPQSEIYRHMGKADCLVVPSEWYEGFPRVVLESLARGTPVIAARIGALPEIIEDGKTGLLFEPGNAAELARAVTEIATIASGMRRAARSAFETKYTGDANYRALLRIYREAGAGRSGTVGAVDS